MLQGLLGFQSHLGLREATRQNQVLGLHGPLIVKGCQLIRSLRHLEQHAYLFQLFGSSYHKSLLDFSCQSLFLASVKKKPLATQTIGGQGLPAAQFIQPVFNITLAFLNDVEVTNTNTRRDFEARNDNCGRKGVLLPRLHDTWRP